MPWLSLRFPTLGMGILLLFSCSLTPVQTSPIKLDAQFLHSFDGDQLPYTQWLPKDQKEEPNLVIIGVHGISGAAADYQPLATHALAKLPRTAIYSAETRGQGNDPIKERRGHIHHREEWFKDLTSFTALIRQKHPNAKIVWCGESMGSLIVLHTYAFAQPRQNLCDAMILSSPIVGIRGDFPRWKFHLARVASFLFPKARLSLESFADNPDVRVTKDTIHSEQATTNSYHVSRHTLHLLTTLGDMIINAPKAGQKLDLPVLLLHGGKDVFSQPEDVENFVENLPPAATPTRKFFPESFHLLFYDHQSDQVIDAIVQWLKSLNLKNPQAQK